MPPSKKSSLLRRPLNPSWIEEQTPYNEHLYLAGVDEVGRGPLAGPVLAAACLFTGPVEIEGIRDSKTLSSKKRAFIAQRLLEHPCVHLGFAAVSPTVIDEINILKASLLAMARAVEALDLQPSYVIVDGPFFPQIPYPGEAVVRGDARSRLIAAASIVAKERRDALMDTYHLEYPLYGFDSHKGYATQQHLEALRKYGPCPIHRRSFSPLDISTQIAYNGAS